MTASAVRISPAVKRYWRRFAVLITAYVVLLFGMIWLLGAGLAVGPARYLAAVLPALPLVGIVIAIGRYLLEERDEFVRHFMVLSLLAGLGVALTITTVWGFLEVAGAPHLNPYWVFPIFGIGMTLAQPFLLWRYR